MNHPLPLRLCRLAATDAGQLSDADALRRYVTDRDAAAFEVLVWRHGPMVWGVVRRVLRHDHDAEDAFQAAFLALAREASRVEGVAGWLHRVAYHVALKSKSKRPRSREAPAERVSVAPDTVALAEVGAILDTEINRLPERYRSAFVLCCLEGKSNAEASRELGCPTGTIDSRLNWARQRLRDRLTRRGVTLAALSPLVLAPELAHAAVTAVTTPRTELLTLAIAGVRAMNRTVAKVIGVCVLAATVLVGVTGWALSANTPAPRPEVAAVVPDVAPVPKEKPENVETSLLYIEDVPKPDRTVEKRRLMRIRFKAGVAGKPEVLHTDTARFFGDFGRHRIHDNRYVVTRYGGVFDLKDNTWIHKEADGEVKAIEGGRVMIGMSNERAQGIFAFDLTKKTLESIGSHGSYEARRLYGTPSPDGTRSIDRGEEQWGLTVFSKDNQVYLGAGFRFSIRNFLFWAASVENLPVLWLDNDHILTQTENGHLVTVNVNDKSRTEIVHIKPVPNNEMLTSPPKLSRDVQDRIVYSIGRDVYRINVAAKTAERTDRQPLGHGFEMMQTTPWVMAHIVFRNGKEIERVPSLRVTLSDPCPTDHYIALIEHRAGQLPEGAEPPASWRSIRVWSAATGKWTTLDLPVNSLVGWVK